MKAYGLVCLLLAGCAAPSGIPSTPKPGTGITEYRDVALQTHRAVADTVDSLQALAQDSSRANTDFDRVFDDLEVTSVKARARAEAIMARGQNYFDEWKQQLATNQPSAQTDYNRLHDHFIRIHQRSSEVREEFRPFMAGLRQFRAKFDQSAATDEINALTTSGRRLLKTLESVSAALNDAEAELHATLSPKR